MSQITASSHADSTAGGPGAPPPALPVTMSRARVGMVCLICTESAFFLTFIVAYLYYIGASTTGPYPREVLGLPLVFLNSACLLSSSVTIVIAIKALRAGARRRFLVFWLLTVLLGAEFLAGTAWEWYGLITEHGLWIDTNLFGTTFYTLVGFHAFHVTVGLLLLTLVFVLGALRHVTAVDAERVEMLSWYWHFVDCIWIVVFFVVYVIGRVGPPVG